MISKRKFLVYMLIIAGTAIMIFSFTEKISFFTGLLLFSLGIMGIIRSKPMHELNERQKILRSIAVIALLVLIIASIIVRL